LIEIWNCPPWPGGLPSDLPVCPEPAPCVVVVAVVPVAEGEAMFATPGEPLPPPQPATSSADAPTATHVRMTGRLCMVRRNSRDSVTAGVRGPLPARNRGSGILRG